MKKILCVFILALCPIISIWAQSEKAYTIQSVPNTYAMDRRMHVSDPDGLLALDYASEINRILTTLEDSTGIQSMVVMLTSIGNEDIFEFSHNLFRHWGIGSTKRNEGLLIVYVADQRKIRFTTGYGLEGILPDAICKRIQTQYMLPHFRNGDTNSGMLEGVRAVVSVLDGSMKASRDMEEASLWEVLMILGCLIALVALFLWLIHRQTNTCPRCGKAGALKLVSTTTTRTRHGRHIRQKLMCSACGHIVEKERHESDNNNNGSMLGGIMLGSMLGRGRGGIGGGGFSGGSFGGGSTGGGGSTSGW